MRAISSINLSAGSVGKGLVIGAGASLLAPIVLPLVGGLLKAVTKGAIKTTMLVYAGSKDVVNKTTATIEEITAEARAEVTNDGANTGATSKAKPSKPTQKAKPKTKKSAAA